MVVDGASFVDNSRRCVIRVLTRTGDIETPDDDLARGFRVVFGFVLCAFLH